MEDNNKESKGSVTIDLELYNELYNLKKEIEAGKSLVIYSGLCVKKIFSSNEEIKKIIEEQNIAMVILANANKKSQESLKSIKDVRKGLNERFAAMSVFEFYKWKRNW